MPLQESDCEYNTESDDARSDRSASPEPDDPTYALSGPHIHNEMSLQGKWPFADVFASSFGAKTSPYLIENTSDKIKFSVRGVPEPQGEYCGLAIHTEGQKQDYVLLFQFVLTSDKSNSKYTTKRFIVHFTLQDPSWLNKKFLQTKEINEWFERATRENVTFVMNFKYNVDHDFICHEPGHIKTFSCRLAKKRFRKCPPERRAFFNNNSLRNSLGEVDIALLRLPLFDTLSMRHHIDELINHLNWLIVRSLVANIQLPLLAPHAIPMYWNIIPFMSTLASQVSVNSKPQEQLPYQELLSNQVLQPFTQQVARSGESAQPLPSLSNPSRHEGLSELPNHLPKASTSRQPEAPNNKHISNEGLTQYPCNIPTTSIYRLPEAPCHGYSSEPLLVPHHLSTPTAYRLPEALYNEHSRNEYSPEFPNRVPPPTTSRLPGVPFLGQESTKRKIPTLSSYSDQSRYGGSPDYPSHPPTSATFRPIGAPYGLKPTKRKKIDPLLSCRDDNGGNLRVRHRPPTSSTSQLPVASFDGPQPGKRQMKETLPNYSNNISNTVYLPFCRHPPTSLTSRLQEVPYYGEPPTKWIKIEPSPPCGADSSNIGHPQFRHRPPTPPTSQPEVRYDGQQPTEPEMRDSLRYCSDDSIKTVYSQFQHRPPTPPTSQLEMAPCNEQQPTEPRRDCSDDSINVGHPQCRHRPSTPSTPQVVLYNGEQSTIRQLIELLLRWTGDSRDVGYSPTSSPSQLQVELHDGQQLTKRILIVTLLYCSRELLLFPLYYSPLTYSISILHVVLFNGQQPTKRRLKATLLYWRRDSRNIGFSPFRHRPATSSTSQLQVVPYNGPTKRGMIEPSPTYRDDSNRKSQTPYAHFPSTCATSCLPGDLYAVPEPVDLRLPAKKTSSSFGKSYTSSNDALDTSTSDNRLIALSCGGKTFTINLKILEVASPVVQAFMKYWTPLVTDPEGGILLELAGVSTDAVANLLKYLKNDSLPDDRIMRSYHMKELTRKLMIDINPIYTFE